MFSLGVKVEGSRSVHLRVVGPFWQALDA